MRTSLFRPVSSLLGSLLAVLMLAPVGRTEPVPWTSQPPLDDPNEFHFAIVADNAANPRPGIFEAALAKLNLLRPEIVLSIGDFVQGYTEGRKPLTDEEVLRQSRAEVDGWLQRLDMPLYRLPGNHDFSSDLSARVWHELYGPDYYSFVYKGVLFLCLNSQDGGAYKAGLGQQQVAWVRETVAQHPDARHTFVFLHQPLWQEDAKRVNAAKARGGAPTLTGFDQVEEALGERPYTVFAGHQHRYSKLEKNGHNYYRLATTGGASALAGPEKGQFDHVVWVTVAKEGPLVCNLVLSGVLDDAAKANMPD